MFNSYIVNKQNLINNIKQVAKLNPNSKICAMVKANAYGVGTDVVVPILNEFVDFYGVACFFEAKKLFKITNKKILIFGSIEQSCVDEKFSYTCSSLEDVMFLKGLNKRINIHLKINTGMNRFGFKYVGEFKKALKEILKSKLKLEGVYTHFATVDSYVETQMKKFLIFKNLVSKYFKDVIYHTDNSMVNLNKNHNLNMVRVGYNLFLNSSGQFKPVCKINSKIVAVNKIRKGEIVGYNKKFVADKNLTVGIVPVGYADGFSIKNIGLELIINNKKCKVLNVCMDCFMVDITKAKIKKGTDVQILGNINSLQNYSKYLSVNEYEVLTNFALIRANKIIC